MIWSLEYAQSIQKDIRKIDAKARAQIKEYLEVRVLGRDDPRSLGKELKGNLGGLWRYRVENHRIICKIEDERMVVLILRIGHRKNIYY